MSKILKQQTARKAVSKRFGRRLENCDGKGFFLKWTFLENALANLQVKALSPKWSLVQKFNIKAF